MTDVRGKTVLITGAASGIGRETALEFSRQGAMPLLADINPAGLEEVSETIAAAGMECSTYNVDVSSREQVVEMARSIESEKGTPDILVNVAGVFVWADIADTTLDDWHWVMGVNLWGPIYTISSLLPGMIERGSGHIVNVASGGGLTALFALGAYSTSKFALVGLGEALEQEVREHGIIVTTICPGSTRTPIIEHIRSRRMNADRLMWGFRLMNRMPASRTARVIVGAVKKNRSLVLTTIPTRVMYYMKRLSPWLFRAMIRPIRRGFNAIMR